MSGRFEGAKARLTADLAARASRRSGWVSGLCRRLLQRALRLPPEQDFMRDEWVDSDQGFDPDELDRYQSGK